MMTVVKDTDYPPDIDSTSHFLVILGELLDSFGNKGSVLAVGDISQGVCRIIQTTDVNQTV